MAEVEIIKANVDINKLGKSQNKERKKRVCAYCRVSTDMEEQLTSYHSQISHYSDFIKQNKDWEFVGIYADEGITGTQINKRVQFIKMIEDCKAKQIDIIIAKSISRFARNTVDTLNTVRLLRNLGIDVYFEKENIHTLKMDSEMFLTLYSAFAQAESESTSMNVKMGYKAKMKRGEPCGSIACYGYNWDKVNKELVINEEEAKVVKKIFAEYLKGKGSTVIARELTEAGIKSPSGCSKWHSSPIKDILRNVKYIGDLCGQKFYVENPMTHKLVRNRGQLPKYYAKNTHEAIIDRDTWGKVQEIYQKRSVVIKEGKEYCEKFSLRYVFSSKIQCQHCGQNYVRRYTKYKNKDGIVHDHVYWTCRSSVSPTTSKKCGKAVTIRDEELKSLFLALYNKFVVSAKKDNLLDKIRDVISKDTSKEKLQKIDKKIIDTKDKLSKLIDLNLQTKIAKDVFEDKNNELNLELMKYENERREIINSKKIKEENRKLRIIEKELSNSKQIHTFDEEIFSLLVKKIIIGHYDEKGIYKPNVVKFVLNLDNVNKNGEGENNIKFLSLELDQRIYKSREV